MKIIHIQTTVQTIFGVLDEEGNVVRKVPLNVEVAKLDHENFHAALGHMKDARDRLSKDED